LHRKISFAYAIIKKKSKGDVFMFGKIKENIKAMNTPCIPVITLDTYPGKKFEILQLVSVQEARLVADPTPLKAAVSVAKESQKIGADAVIGFRCASYFDTRSLNRAVVLGYGTAIKFIAEE
jgi:hypothetical protein